MLGDLIVMQLHVFISIAVLPVFMVRKGKDGENVGIIVKNKHVNGLEINLDCVLTTFTHRFSMFNIC